MPAGTKIPAHLDLDATRDRNTKTEIHHIQHHTVDLSPKTWIFIAAAIMSVLPLIAGMILGRVML